MVRSGERVLPVRYQRRTGRKGEHESDFKECRQSAAMKRVLRVYKRTQWVHNDETGELSSNCSTILSV